MVRYFGFWQNGHRYEIRVPTTVSDDRVATINAYRGRFGSKGRKVATVPVALRELPYWDVQRQRIALRGKDQSAVNEATQNLISRLANN